MRFTSVGNKADVVFISVKNASVNSIPGGAPVFIAANGTDDGLAVTDANIAATAQASLCVGLATDLLAVGQLGEAQVFGMCTLARVITGTRAASTNAFNSNAAIALGDLLLPVTDSGVNGLTRNAAGATGSDFPGFIAMATLAAVASSVGSTATGLVRTQGLKVFVRCL